MFSNTMALSSLWPRVEKLDAQNFTDPEYDHQKLQISTQCIMSLA